MPSSRNAKRSWDLAAGLVTLWVSLLILAHWPILPWFLDYFYHMAVVAGFLQSGGLVLHEWWEFAPAGRVHLYPPLWHLITLPAAQLGIPLLILSRLWCVLFFPLIACLVWRIVRELFDDRSAAWCIFLLATPLSLTAAILNYPAASLATVFSLLAWWALERRRLIAASIAVGFLGLTHTGLFCLFVLTLLFYAALRKDLRNEIGVSLGVGFLIASPWLIHQGLHVSALHVAARRETILVELAPILLILAAWGARCTWRNANVSRFCVAWWLGTLPMVVFYRFRLLAGHGLLPVVLLAGLGAADLWKRGTACRVGLMASLCLWPVWHQGLDGAAWKWADTSIVTLASAREGSKRITTEPLYIERFWEPIGLALQSQTTPDELFACNTHYGAGLLTVLSGRSTTTGMLGEITPPKQDPIANARLLVWLKESAQGRPSRQMEKVALQYHLQPLGETDISYLYFNNRPQGRRQTRKAVLPWWLSTVLIGFLAGWLVSDLRKTNGVRPRGV